MEHLSSENGLTNLVAGVLIALCLHLVVKLFNFGLNLVRSLREVDNKKMDHLTKSMEENTKAIYELSAGLQSLNNRIVETDIATTKYEVSHSRLVATVKELAGDQWSTIQEKVRKDEFNHG